MSSDIDSDPRDSTVALYLMNNDGDELTDILVAALEDAFRILKEEWARTMHSGVCREPGFSQRPTLSKGARKSSLIQARRTKFSTEAASLSNLSSAPFRAISISPAGRRVPGIGTVIAVRSN